MCFYDRMGLDGESGGRHDGTMVEGGRKIWYRDTESLDMCSELCFNKEGCVAVNYDVRAWTERAGADTTERWWRAGGRSGTGTPRASTCAANSASIRRDASPSITM